MSANFLNWMLPADVLSDATAATWTSSGAATGFAVGSLQTSLPGDAFRFGGLFRILAGGSVDNDKLDFIDSGPVSHTVTLTAGDYTGASLASHLQTVMNAASAQTFTVTYSATTGKFTIAETGNYTLKWSSGASAETPRLGTLLGFDTSADDNGASTYTADNVAIHSEEWLQVDMGSSVTPGAGWLMGHFLSSSADVKVYGHSADLTSPAAGVTYRSHFGSTGTEVKTLTMASDVLVQEENDFGSWTSTGTYRYFVISLIDTVPRESAMFHEFGRVGMGTLTTPTRDYRTGFGWPVQDLAPRQGSVGGVLFAPRLRQPRAWTGSFARLGNSDRDDLIALFRAGRKPLAFWFEYQDGPKGGMYGQIVGKSLNIQQRGLSDQWDIGPLTVAQVPKRVV